MSVILGSQDGLQFAHQQTASSAAFFLFLTSECDEPQKHVKSPPGNVQAREPCIGLGIFPRSHQNHGQARSNIVSSLQLGLNESCWHCWRTCHSKLRKSLWPLPRRLDLIQGIYRYCSHFQKDVLRRLPCPSWSPLAPGSWSQPMLKQLGWWAIHMFSGLGGNGLSIDRFRLNRWRNLSRLNNISQREVLCQRNGDVTDNKLRILLMTIER